MYIKDTTGHNVDLDDRSKLFQALQANSHIVGKYFDLRTQCYFEEVMKPVFGVDTYWYRQEFAKSRGMIHWHGLCWRKDREPHNLLHTSLQEGLSDEDSAKRLAEWATSELAMTASHPSGKTNNGDPRKDLWPPPEGSGTSSSRRKEPPYEIIDGCQQFSGISA